MPRRIRIQDPDLIYFVTNTALERRFLLLPGRSMNDIFRKRLRQAVAVHRVELIAAVCMGNHFHLIVRCPMMNLGRFMCYFQGLLARDVLKLRDTRESVVFPRRYSAEPILDQEALLKKMAYVVLNPVKARIVSAPADYPGYTSWHDIVGSHPQDLGIEPSEKPPKLTPPPFWANLSADEVRERWIALVTEVISALHSDGAFRVLGAKRALRLKHWEKPWRRRRSQGGKAGRTKKPRAHASTVELWQTYVRFADRVTDLYRQQMVMLRSGETVQFPYGTRPPGWAECECDSRRLLPKRCQTLWAPAAFADAA